MATTIVAGLVQTGGSSSEAQIRQHWVVIDRPAANGGTDEGPMGGELFLAAVGGCFMSTLLAAAKARSVELSHTRVDVTGTLEPGPARFHAVDLQVSTDGCDPAVFDQLVEIADRGCIMTNTVRAALSLTIRSH